jgi:hypothetical protein
MWRLSLGLDKAAAPGCNTGCNMNMQHGGAQKPMHVVLGTDQSGKPARPLLLYGVSAIAAHVGIAEEAARHLIRKGVLPAFKIGRTVAARPERIDAALAALEHQQQTSTE